MTIRIVIIDDQELFTKALGAYLDHQANIELVDTATTPESALELAKEKKIDVAIVDIRIPGMNGIEITRELLILQKTMKVISITGDFVERHVGKMMAAGARGFVLKCCSIETLCEAIEKVHAGGLYLCEDTIENLVECHKRRELGSFEIPLEKLTQREFTILHLVLDGLNNKDISQQLDISEKTVEGHRTNIMKKMGVDSMVELTKLGIRAGIISLFD